MPERSQRILIIDDEADSVRLLMAYLAERYSDLMIALDGEDGLAKARRGQPALVLLDVKMPGLDGFEVCQRLKADPATAAIPVIFLSGQSFIDDKLRGFEVGAVDYITKPFSDAEVLARVALQLEVHARMQRTQAMADSLLRASLPPPQAISGDEQLLRRACEHLQAHLRNAPDLAGLARELRTSERRLSTLFRQRLGLSVFDYAQELRLGHARQLLDTTALQVQRVADLVGYQNAGDFTRAFRRRFGVTPGQFRQVAKGASGDASQDAGDEPVPATGLRA